MNDLIMVYSDGITEKSEITDTKLSEELPYMMESDALVKVVVNGKIIKDINE